MKCRPPSGPVLASALEAVATCPARTVLALQQLLAVPPSQAWDLADILLSHIQVGVKYISFSHLFVIVVSIVGTLAFRCPLGWNGFFCNDSVIYVTIISVFCCL
jgi:hypothetical protein